MGLTSEQATSAHEMLRNAKVRHGNVVEVEMAVGVPFADRPHVAFCSGVAKQLQVMKKARYWERRQPIVGEIEFKNGDEIAKLIAGQAGILHCKAQVFTNGHVEITIDPASVRVVPVQPLQLEILRHRSGKALTETVLQSKV